jgi:hypothetical protein
MDVGSLLSDRALCGERECDMFPRLLVQVLCAMTRHSALRCFPSLSVPFRFGINILKISVALKIFLGKKEFSPNKPQSFL